MNARITLAVLAIGIVACSTSMMLVEAGTDGGDASFTDASVESGFESSTMTDADAQMVDCGMLDGDAGICELPTYCTADPPPDASRCYDDLDASCGVLFRLLAECQRKYTVCSPFTCKTDLGKTGTSIQQNCGSQSMAYQNCKM